MFSPMVAIFSVIYSETVCAPPAIVQFLRASTSAASLARIVSVMVSTSSRNLSLFAQKSVSQLISTITPFVPLTLAFTIPSAAILPAFLAAFARPFSRRILTASSLLPSASTRALLQSIMPQPVISRSSLTSLAVILAIFVLL